MRPCDRFDWERLVKRSDALTGRQVYVGLALATFADADGTRVRPGVDALADDCRCSPATARRAVKALVAYGLLHQVRRGGGFSADGGGLATEYRLVWPSQEQLAVLQLRAPDEPRSRRLSAHQRAKSPAAEPVVAPTLRSPACEESGRAEPTLRPWVTDSPFTRERLSAHPGDQVPTDQPRPDHQQPPAGPKVEIPSPQPTRTRETAPARDVFAEIIGPPEQPNLPAGPKWKRLREVAEDLYVDIFARKGLDLAQSGALPRDWMEETSRSLMRRHWTLLANAMRADLDRWWTPAVRKRVKPAAQRSDAAEGVA